MDKISVNDINNIRSSVDIVDIISDYLPLVNKGRNYFGVCPFHDDNHPSMSVSKEKQIYKCFSCGATGNVFNFIMDYENITFKEALSKVATLAGISIDIGEVREKSNPYQKMYEAYDIAFKFYQNNINTIEGKEAKEYLKKRNIDENIIKEFGIGLSLSKRDLLSKMLLKKGFEQNVLNESGLLLFNDGGYFDMYVKRIMFPLWDTSGKVVGFSGRIYNGEDISKYINTKETPIFKKGELLYNYHRAKEEARKNKTIIVMEGFMDVIRTYSVGIKNVVATMGTAVTKEQALLIKRLAPNVILCFDGDEAGAKATFACISELQKIGVIPKVVRLEENLDPDEYVQKYGKESFLSKIENPINVMDFKLSHYKKNKNLESSIEKAEYVKNILDELSKIDDEILRELTLQKLSVESNLDINFLKSRLPEINKNINELDIVVNTDKRKNYGKYELAERCLIYYMLKNKEVIKVYNNKTPYMPDEKYRHLAREIVSYYQINGIISSADLITELMKYNNDLVSLIGDIESSDFKENYTLDEINDYIGVINEFNIKKETSVIKEKMRNETDPIKKAELAQKIMDLKLRGDN